MRPSYTPRLGEFLAALRVFPGKTIKWWRARITSPTRPVDYLKFRDWILRLIRLGLVASVRQDPGAGAPHHLWDPADPALPGRPCQPDVREI